MRVCSGFFVLVMFLCGAVVGGLGDHWWLQRSTTVSAKTHLMERMKDDLSLSAEQSRQMEAILDDAMRDFDDLHQKAHRVRQDSKERIRAILDEKQKPIFDASWAKLQRELGQ